MSKPKKKTPAARQPGDLQQDWVKRVNATPFRRLPHENPQWSGFELGSPDLCGLLNALIEHNESTGVANVLAIRISWWKLKDLLPFILE